MAETESKKLWRDILGSSPNPSKPRSASARNVGQLMVLQDVEVPSAPVAFVHAAKNFVPTLVKTGKSVHGGEGPTQDHFTFE